MDRLKLVQNGLIFPFESALRIDPREPIAAMTPSRKKTVPRKDARTRAAADGEGEERCPVWRCYTEFDSKGDQLYEVKG